MVSYKQYEKIGSRWFWDMVILVYCVQAGSLINPTRVMYFSAKNYSADFSETRGIDWTLLGASN